MSLSDITLNGRTYAVTSVGENSVLRVNFAAVSPIQNTLLISHTYGTGTKPNRHLVQFRGALAHPTTGELAPAQGHVVYTVPKWAIGTDMGNLTADMSALLATSGFLGRLFMGGAD